MTLTLSVLRDCCDIRLMCMFTVFFFLMRRRPPRSTRTDTLFPYTTLFRSMAFGCLGLSLLMVVGLLWQLGRSTVTPYVVEVDRLGEVRAVGPALEAYR